MPDLDFDMDSMDFVFEDGDMVLIQDSVIKELQYRIDTNKGSHWFYPDYGNPSMIVGLMRSQRQHFAIQQAIQDVCDQDDRIGNYELRLDSGFSTIKIQINLNGQSVASEVG